MAKAEKNVACRYGKKLHQQFVHGCLSEVRPGAQSYS